MNLEDYRPVIDAFLDALESAAKALTPDMDWDDRLVKALRAFFEASFAPVKTRAVLQVTAKKDLVGLSMPTWFSAAVNLLKAILDVINTATESKVKVSSKASTASAKVGCCDDEVCPPLTEDILLQATQNAVATLAAITSAHQNYLCCG